MHGNNKTEAELLQALDAGVGHVIVDSLDEIDRLERLAAGRRQRVLLRVTPGIRPDTHEKIATGQEDSKFGIPLAALPAAVERCEAAGLEVRGLHAHIGSQVFDLDVYERLAEVLLAGRRLSRDQHRRRLRRRLHPRPVAAAAPRPTPRRCWSGCPTGSRSSASPAARWSPTRASPSTRSAPSRMSPGCAATSPSTAAWPTTFARCSTAPTTKRRSPTGSGTPTPCRLVGMHCESGDILIEDARLEDPRGRRRPRHPGDRRLRPLDGEQLQRRPQAAGDLLQRGRRPRRRPPRDLRGSDRT